MGSEIDEHVHTEQDDLIYVLEGEATMWIEGTGEFPLTPGTFVAVTRGKRHRTFAVEEALLIPSRPPCSKYPSLFSWN